ncbi:MAG: acyl-CoA dehydrogenase family protein, partial [Dehalococcoidia bacterium]
MKFQFTPEQDAFRAELREFLAAEVPASQATGGQDREFSKKLAARGWIGIAWPEEYGGGGRGAIDQMIYNEEMILASAPRGYHFTAERQVGPSVIL